MAEWTERAELLFTKEGLENLKPYFNNENFRLYHGDSLQILSRFPDDSIDMIFADPPYEHLGIALLPEIVFANNLLTPEGMLIIEHRSSFNFNHGKLFDKRDYGQSRFSFFRNTPISRQNSRIITI